MFRNFLTGQLEYRNTNLIYLITTVIGDKNEQCRFYSKGDALSHYRMKVRELAFPDTIIVEILNDGEDNA